MNFIFLISRRDEDLHQPLLDRFATYLLCAMIAFAPLPFGSVTTPVVASENILLGLILALLGTGSFSRRDAYFVGAIALVGCCWATTIALQVLPRDPSLDHLAHPIWREANQVLATDLSGYATAVRNQPFFSAQSEIACALSLLCGYLIGRRRFSARLLLNVFAVSGLLYAIYGIIMLSIAPRYVLWLEKVAYQNVLTSTFINANTAAIYFGACALAWHLIFIEQVTRSNLKNAFLRPSPRTLFVLISFVVTLSACFMTGSRLGSVLTLFVICGATATRYRHAFNTWSAVGTGLLTSIGFAAIAFELLGGLVSERFEAGGLSGEGRLEAYLSTWRIISDYPWLGTGLGTFRWVFPAYRSADISIVGIWDHAHNTTLEIASEMGIPFLSIVVAGWIAIFAVVATGIGSRKRDKIFPIFSFWVSWLVILHSQLDFSLQIPGLSIVVLAPIGAGIAQSEPSGARLDSTIGTT